MVYFDDLMAFWRADISKDRAAVNAFTSIAPEARAAHQSLNVRGEDQGTVIGRLFCGHRAASPAAFSSEDGDVCPLLTTAVEASSVPASPPCFEEQKYLGYREMICAKTIRSSPWVR